MGTHAKVVLALLLAAACGMALGTAGGFGVGALRGGGGEEDLSLPDAPQEEDEAPVSLFDQPREPGPEPPAPSANPRNLEEAIQDLPLPDLATGTGRITGVVRTEYGHPLSGVRVVATPVAQAPAASRGKTGFVTDEELEERVRAWIVRARIQDATKSRAATGGDGAFALEGLADTAYEVQAFHKKYELSSVGFQDAARARPGAALVFVATVRTRVSATVLLPDGARAGSARILSGQGRQRREVAVWTPQAPVFPLPPGQHRLQAEAGEHGEFVSQVQIVFVPPDGRPAAATFRLRAQAGIAGKVAVPRGLQVNFVGVYVMRLTPGQAPDPKALFSKGTQKWVNAWSGYRYAFKDLSPGVYLLGVTQDHRTVAATETVEVAHRLVVRDLKLPEPTAQVSVVVRVVGPDGQALRDAKVQTGFQSSRGHHMPGGTVVAQQDGTFRILHPELEDGREREGAYYVTAASETLGRKTVTYAPRDAGDLQVVLESAGRLVVTVKGYEESPLKGKLKCVLMPSGEDAVASRALYAPQMNQASLDGGGKAVFEPCQPGPYTLLLVRGSMGWETVPLCSMSLGLTAGENETAVAVPEVHSFSVTFENAKADARVYLEPWVDDQQWRLRRSVGSDRKVTFEDLPAGRYTLTMYGGILPAQMDVILPGPSELVFQPKPIDAIEVRVYSAGGELARLGFKDRDLIVGIDGTEFQGTQHLQATVFKAMMKQTVKAMVLRGKKRVDISINAQRFLSNEGGLGGSFNPTSRKRD